MRFIGSSGVWPWWDRGGSPGRSIRLVEIQTGRAGATGQRAAVDAKNSEREVELQRLPLPLGQARAWHRRTEGRAA
jgi:hypothetical protein